MNLLMIAEALMAGLYGLYTLLRKKAPLFYKLVVYGGGCYLLALLYSMLHALLVPGDSSFHAGYLGYAGTFFFLFSSYYGALDRLADDRSVRQGPWRWLAVLALLCVAAGSWWMCRRGYGLSALLLLPVAGTAYYACKHLLLPDVERGIVRALRPYNAVIVLLCLLQPLTMPAVIQRGGNSLLTLMNTTLVFLALILAHRGCVRWFI